MDLKLVVVLLIHQAWVTDLVSAHCDPFSGPVGKAECVPLDGYIGSQWATCLSNSYIQEKSRGRHICKDMPELGGKPDYCYYQCQIEVYDEESGPVYGKCKCDSTAVSNLIPNSYDYNNLGDYDQLMNEYEKLMHDLETTTKKDVEIADWCTSPDGTECTWFNECLNRRYPCTAAETGYTLDFAQGFCNLYLHVFQRDVQFSTQGLRWVNAVRKCLQVALVPQIRPWMAPTCGDIKQEALDSHQHCYLSAYPDAPSICDITCRDWAMFFWTAKSKGTYLHMYSFTETMKTAIDAMSTCGQNASILGPGCPSKILRLTLNYETSKIHYADDTVNAQDQLAGEITDQLAKRLKWDSEVMGWFAFAPNVHPDDEYDDDDPDSMTVNIILGDLFAVGSYIYPDLDLVDIENDFIDALQGGQLYDLNLNHGKASVSILEVCEDMQCDQTSKNATAGPRPTTAPKKNFAATINAQAVAVLMCAILALFIQ